jgi:hypothetical protein
MYIKRKQMRDWERSCTVGEVCEQRIELIPILGIVSNYKHKDSRTRQTINQQVSVEQFMRLL